MKRRIGLVVVCLCLLLTCALAEGRTRWLNSDIDGNVTEETVVNLKDDFHLAVNYDWIMAHTIENGKTAAGSLQDVSKLVEERKTDLMKDETLEGHDAELVHRIYRLVSDWDARNALGVEPLRPYIEEIQHISSLEEMTAYLLASDGVLAGANLVGARMSPGLDDPNQYAVWIETAKLSLSDAAEYRELTQNGTLVKTANEAVVRIVLGKLGFTDEETDVVFESRLAFETQMAAHSFDAAVQNQPDYYSLINNEMDGEALAVLAGTYPIMELLSSQGLGESRVYIVTEPEYVKSLQELYTEENLEGMKSWLLCQVALSGSNFLDWSTLEETTKARNAVYGVDTMKEQESIVYDMVNRLLPVPMDNLYIQKWCTEKMQKDILGIISEVLENYHEMLAGETWLSEATQEKAIEKLDAIHIRAVYPDELGDWSGLELPSPEDGGNLVEAYLAIGRFLAAQKAEKVNTTVNRDQWDQTTMPASAVNAFYDPQDNSINIMAGILNGAFYDESMSRAELLGSIGVAIGHEITHAFDTTGSQFDKNGMLNDWWEEADKAAFTARADRVSDYLSVIVPFENAVVNGDQIRKEVIADLGGMKCMLEIASKTEGFDYEVFFRQFAKLWVVKNLYAAEVRLNARDAHPLPYIRTNVAVQQFDEFLKAFDIGEGDGMYLAPEDRILVW